MIWFLYLILLNILVFDCINISPLRLTLKKVSNSHDELTKDKNNSSHAISRSIPPTDIRTSDVTP